MCVVNLTTSFVWTRRIDLMRSTRTAGAVNGVNSVKFVDDRIT